MSKDERKIPKIVLKCGPGSGKAEVCESERLNSNEHVYSSEIASYFAQEFYKIGGEGSSLPFSELLRKVNQSSYKSLENVLEL